MKRRLLKTVAQALERHPQAIPPDCAEPQRVARALWDLYGNGADPNGAEIHNARRLVFLSEWPVEWAERFESAQTVAEQARVTALYLRDGRMTNDE